MFAAVARRITDFTGSPLAIAAATLACVAWYLLDESFDWLDGVSALTFWMLFSLQSSQNADTAEMRSELRELVRAVPEADERVIEETP